MTNAVDDEPGGCVQPCGRKSTGSAEAPGETPHWLYMHWKSATGHDIADEEPFTLVYPSGRTELGMLHRGVLNRADVPEGLYSVGFARIVGCSWDRPVAVGEPTCAMTVATQGFADGVAVLFRLFRQFQSTDTDPLFECEATLTAGRAAATWTYKQGLCETPGGYFVFEALINGKLALSDCLDIQAYSIQTIAGVQQRLKERSYDPGVTDGVLGPKTKNAVAAFQRAHPPLKVDGLPGLYTTSELSLR